MWTVVVFSKELSQTTEPAYLDPVFDDHVRVEPPNVIVPDELPFLAGVFVERTFPFSVNERVQVEAPSLRRILLRDVEFQISQGSVDKIPNWAKMFYNPIPLEPREPLRVRSTQLDSGTKRVNAYVFLSDGPQTSVGGEIYTVLATTEGSITAYSWSTLKLNITQVLPSGRYQLVGARVLYSPGGVFRFIFVGQAWRPGGIVSTALGGHESVEFRRGGLGVWGEFTHDQPPVLQVFSVSTGTGVIAYLDLIKIE